MTHREAFCSIVGSLALLALPRAALAQCSGSSSITKAQRQYDNTCPDIHVHVDYAGSGSMACNDPGLGLQAAMGEWTVAVFVTASGVCSTTPPMYWCNYAEPAATVYMNSFGVLELHADWYDGIYDTESNQCGLSALQYNNDTE